MRQLTDIALRALSPGINDPTTAINCIDYLGVVLSRAAAREPEPLWRADEGELRVIGRSATFEQMVDEGLGDIRRYSDGHLFEHSPPTIRRDVERAHFRAGRRRGDPAVRRLAVRSSL